MPSPSLALDLVAARLRDRELCDRLGHGQQLEDADPAAVAGLVAAGTPLLPVERHSVRWTPRHPVRRAPRSAPRRSASTSRSSACTACGRAAGRGPPRRRRRQERLDAHLVQARERARRVVRVQRREDEVTGQRGLDRDLGRLAVPDLADHHHIGVGAQDRRQRGREGQAGAWLI